MGNRFSYAELLGLGSFILLDETKTKVVASVRAKDAEEARRIFKQFGLEGSWIRKGAQAQA